MRRGVDSILFNPARRRRVDSVRTIDYAGRLAVEQNVHFLTRIEDALIAAGISDFRFLIVGDGKEKDRLAAGVPAVVTADGGPKFIVRSGETGFIAQLDSAFLRCVLELARDPVLACKMGLAARRQGMETSWDAVWAEMVTAWQAICAQRVSVPA